MTPVPCARHPRFGFPSLLSHARRDIASDPERAASVPDSVASGPPCAPRRSSIAPPPDPESTARRRGRPPTEETLEAADAPHLLRRRRSRAPPADSCEGRALDPAVPLALPTPPFVSFLFVGRHQCAASVPLPIALPTPPFGYDSVIGSVFESVIICEYCE